MRKVTTVSLDENTAKIAKQMPNFSHFVRECLLRYHANTASKDFCTYSKQKRFANRCVPRAKDRPVCFVCWPHGRPSQDLVTMYLRDHKDIARLDRDTKAENWMLLDIDQSYTVQREEPENMSLQVGGKRSFMQKIATKLRLKR